MHTNGLVKELLGDLKGFVHQLGGTRARMLGARHNGAIVGVGPRPKRRVLPLHELVPRLQHNAQDAHGQRIPGRNAACGPKGLGKRAPDMTVAWATPRMPEPGDNGPRRASVRQSTLCHIMLDHVEGSGKIDFSTSSAAVAHPIDEGTRYTGLAPLARTEGRQTVSEAAVPSPQEHRGDRDRPGLRRVAFRNAHDPPGGDQGLQFWRHAMFGVGQRAHQQVIQLVDQRGAEVCEGLSFIGRPAVHAGCAGATKNVLQKPLPRGRLPRALLALRHLSCKSRNFPSQTGLLSHFVRPWAPFTRPLCPHIDLGEGSCVGRAS
mmetsp:Transcript_28388/g.50729  ORF Transcript_28388/g.50729 Transcript_28388/m.50729 type:complete len:319 (-) Transcript_28388:1435-2391(-)